MKVSKNLMLSLLACLSGSNQISLGMAEFEMVNKAATPPKKVSYASQAKLSLGQLTQLTKTLKAEIAKQQEANLNITIQNAGTQQQGGPVQQAPRYGSARWKQEQIDYQTSINVDLSNLLQEEFAIQNKLSQQRYPMSTAL
ncbi:MAG: hypothetical protein NTU89_00680 [Candidatus Dependentiae bacterium]|nr:hypothetical protein [Candidatus Dependentiae bacterium]